MNKIAKYLNYGNAYISSGDFRSLLDSVRFLLLKKGALRTRVADSHLGKIKIRQGTNDFQFANYYYEWNVKSYILSIYHDFNIFIDIGSGIGDYSLLMAKKGLLCFAFEPIADNFKTLTENVRLNRLERRIKPFQLALGNAQTTVDFAVTQVNTGASHRADIHLSDKIPVKCNEKVKVEKLDNLFLDFGLTKQDRVLMKLDMEGMEVEGIAGALDFIRTYPNLTIIAEAKHSGDDEIINTLKSIAEFEFGRVDDLNIYAHKINNL